MLCNPAKCKVTPHCRCCSEVKNKATHHSKFDKWHRDTEEGNERKRHLPKEIIIWEKKDFINRRQRRRKWEKVRERDGEDENESSVEFKPTPSMPSNLLLPWWFNCRYGVPWDSVLQHERERQKERDRERTGRRAKPHRCARQRLHCNSCYCFSLSHV